MFDKRPIPLMPVMRCTECHHEFGMIRQGFTDWFLCRTSEVADMTGIIISSPYPYCLDCGNPLKTHYRMAAWTASDKWLPLVV